MVYKAVLGCSVFALLGTLAPAASAAERQSSGPNPQAPSVGSTVQEVVVTARKRSENLQAIPESITALTGRQLDQQGIRQASDLQRNVPSLSIQGSSVTTSTGMIVSIRGQVATDYLLTISQPVGIYEDSVNIPHPAGTNIGLFDLDRIEVLKGPQGTLYGRNTTGGAINIVTRGADYDGVHGYVLGEVGNYSDWKLGGAVNVPLLRDVLAVRLAYQHWNREGFGRSAFTGQRLGDSRDDDIARAVVRFDPVASLSSRLEVEYVQAHRTGNLYQTRELLSPALADLEWRLEGSRGGVPPSQLAATAGHDLFTNWSVTNNYDRIKGWHIAWDSTWRINDHLSLRSITGLHKFTDFQITELGAGGVQTFGEGVGVGGKPYVAGVDTRPLRPDQKSRQWTQEFDLSGMFWEDRVSWLVGAFASDDEGSENQTASIYPALVVASAVGAFDVSFFDPKASTKTWAVFTQNDIKLNDVFSITAGLRYTEERLSSDSSFMLHFLTPGIFVCQAGPNLGKVVTTEAACITQESAKANGTSYLLSFNFQLTPRTLFYVKTARGFRGGALQERAPGTAPARPEISTDYELGLKSDAFDGRLRANLAAYLTNYENKQETAIVGLSSGAIFTPIVNAATAQIRGVEAELTAIPATGVTLNANIGYLDGQYQNYKNALTPWNTILPNASGVAFAVPRWTVDLQGHYTRAIGPGDATFTVDYAWTSKIPTTPLNNDPSLSPALQAEWRKSIGLLNMTLDYHLADLGLNVTLFATNLANEHYQRAAITFASQPSPYGYTGTTMAPRTYGVTVRKSFGRGE